jgi:hypothetical protein
MKEKIKEFLALPLWRDYRTLFVVWMLIAIIAGVIKHDNNFLIYKFVFWHVIEQKDLYLFYPEEFGDLNHYGPFFSYVIAPFAWMPVKLGGLLWNICLALLLFVAIKTARFSKYETLFILWYSANDLMTCLMRNQFNVAVAALILLSFTMVERKKDFWAAFFICVGMYVKLLGVVGIAFFFFSHDKRKFVLSMLFWCVVMFVAPMLISSPEYIVGQYESWYHALQAKNATNSATRTTDNNTSLLGIFRKTLINSNYSDLWVIIPGMIIVALGYFRVSQWKNLAFRKMVLVQMLLVAILFSTGTENSSYVIAYIGIPLWYASVPWQRSRFDMFLMVFAFVCGSLAPTDIYPEVVRHEVFRAYALRALPVALIWAKLSWEMMTRDYSVKEIRQ